MSLVGHDKNKNTNKKSDHPTKRNGDQSVASVFIEPMNQTCVATVDLGSSKWSIVLWFGG